MISWATLLETLLNAKANAVFKTMRTQDGATETALNPVGLGIIEGMRDKSSIVGAALCQRWLQIQAFVVTSGLHHA